MASKNLAFLALWVLLSAVPARAGLHNGEQGMLAVDIAFSDAYGTTVTDAQGTHYNFYGLTFHEDKVYPQQYWGNFPLYFFGTRVGVTVRLKNEGPRQKAKLRVRTSSYVLRTDGSNGAPLVAPAELEVELARGEEKVIDASFTADGGAAAESGLDRFVVEVLHPNQGGGPGNANPALILRKEGVFCPPEYARSKP